VKSIDNMLSSNCSFLSQRILIRDFVSGREIIKGIADTERDKLRNIQTLAIKLNPKNLNIT